MSRRRVRKRRQSRFMLLLITAVVAVVVISCTARTLQLRQRRADLAITETSLEMQLAEANLKSEQLKEKEMYMQTKKYIEDEAKSKLGLVYPDEIVIKPKEKDN